MTREARIYNEEWTVSLISGAEKTEQLHVNAIHKNKLKIDQRSKCKTGYYKIIRGKYMQNAI